MPTVSKSRTTARKMASSRKAGAKSRGASAARKTSARAKSRTTRKPSKTATSSRGGKARGKTTIDHNEIREWVEARGGSPATVTGTERDSEAAGLLRIDFPGYSGKGTLEHIDWDEFFEKFEESGLAFLYENKKGSRFNKLVARKGKRF